VLKVIFGFLVVVVAAFLVVIFFGTQASIYRCSTQTQATVPSLLVMKLELYRWFIPGNSEGMLHYEIPSKGFDSATFQISANGAVLDNQMFTDLASAQAFFSNNLINITLLVGLNIIQLSLNEMISGGDGFSFDYAAIAPTPVPPTLLLFATGLGGLGLLGWRRKKAA
jgi:hypothetical protein